jgi:hypothetical protein
VDGDRPNANAAAGTNDNGAAWPHDDDWVRPHDHDWVRTHDHDRTDAAARAQRAPGKARPTAFGSECHMRRSGGAVDGSSRHGFGAEAGESERRTENDGDKLGMHGVPLKMLWRTKTHAVRRRPRLLAQPAYGL